MIKLLEIIKINKPVPNNLKQLKQIQSQIKSSNDLKERQELATKAAELVLPIWNHYYPNDKRPQKAIESAKLYLADPTEENKVKLIDAADAAYAANDEAYENDAAAADAAYAADDEAYENDAAAADAAYAAYYAAYAVYADAAYDANTAAAAINATKTHFKINEIIKVNKPYSDKVEREWRSIGPGFTVNNTSNGEKVFISPYVNFFKDKDKPDSLETEIQFGDFDGGEAEAHEVVNQIYQIFEDKGFRIRQVDYPCYGIILTIDF